MSHEGGRLGHLYLGVSLADIRGRISADRRTGLIVSGLILLLGVILSLVLAAKIVRPLESLRAAADEIAAGHLSVRVETVGRDEVAILGNAFNSMASRLSESVEALASARDAALAGTRAKADFLAMMSHEIRTPMNGVLGMLDLLRRADLTQEHLEFATTAYASAEALLIILDDIVDFSKMEEGKLSLEAVEFVIRDTLEDVCGLMATRANAKGIELVYLVEDEVPTHVTADEGRIRQILINLSGNAIKFTEEGGEVVVRVSAHDFSGDTATVHFSVRDDGIGISPEAQKRLFQPFEQADASTTRRFGGTGLGLSISRRLVEAMDGRIGLESELGVGTTFWFELTLRVSQGSEKQPSEVDLTGVRGLVVDDNTTNRQVLKKQMERWGMQVTVAEDGPSALAHLQDVSEENLPTVAILDMQMPGMDGLALAQVMRRNPRTSQITLILATSVPNETRITPGSDPFDVKLAKPVRQFALQRAISSTLGRSTPAGEDAQPGNREAPPEIRELGVSLRILLVEDNPVNQMVAQLLLEELGHEIEIAENGQEALDMVERSSFDVVFMDCQMPIMDGLEATREIRRGEMGKTRVPIIAMTANALNEDRLRCLEAGMDDHLAKPVSIASLAEVISRTFDVSNLVATRPGS